MNEAAVPFDRARSLAFDRELLEQDQRTEAGITTGEHLTDLGNARRLVKLHGADLRFVPGRGFLDWDGRRWQHDDSGEVVRRVKATIRSIYQEAANEPEKSRRDALVDHARRSESEARITAAVKLASTEPELLIKTDRLDADPFLLTVENGTVNLRTGAMQPHRREDYITRLLSVPFRPDSTCPTWRAFLERIMASRQDVISFLQRAIGYSLTGDTSEQCLFLLYGSGANGKSTLINVLMDLLGDYATQAAPEVLLARRHDEHPAAIADLDGPRLVAAVEVAEGRRLAENLVKQLTGGDRVKARRLYENFSGSGFIPRFKLWLAVNHRPVIRGTDLAIWRRVRLIPFTVTIPELEQDRHLLDKLRAELPGILAWAVEGVRAWQERGLRAPEAVTEATDAYRQDSDLLAAFLAERCTVSSDAWTTKRELFKAFTTWADESGESPMSKRVFGERLQERDGITEGRDGTRGRYWSGIGLLNQVTQ